MERGCAGPRPRVACQATSGSVLAPLAPLAPEPGDRFLLKPRYSAFDHTPLALLLRELETERVVLVGATTEGCAVQSGLDARELGFKVTILAEPAQRPTRPGRPRAPLRRGRGRHANQRGRQVDPPPRSRVGRGRRFSLALRSLIDFGFHESSGRDLRQQLVGWPSSSGVWPSRFLRHRPCRARRRRARLATGLPRQHHQPQSPCLLRRRPAAVRDCLYHDRAALGPRAHAGTPRSRLAARPRDGDRPGRPLPRPPPRATNARRADRSRSSPSRASSRPSEPRKSPRTQTTLVSCAPPCWPAQPRWLRWYTTPTRGRFAAARLPPRPTRDLPSGGPTREQPSRRSPSGLTTVAENWKEIRSLAGSLPADPEIARRPPSGGLVQTITVS